MPGLINLTGITYVIYKRNGNGGVNKGKVHFNPVAKNKIILKVAIITVNALSKGKNGSTPF